MHIFKFQGTQPHPPKKPSMGHVPRHKKPIRLLRGWRWYGWICGRRWRCSILETAAKFKFRKANTRNIIDDLRNDFEERFGIHHILDALVLLAKRTKENGKFFKVKRFEEIFVYLAILCGKNEDC